MTPKRLPRGIRIDPVRVAWMVERSQKERFEQLASHAGVSGAVFFERMVLHLEDELTDRGVPNWWPEPEPSDGELPIDAA